MEENQVPQTHRLDRVLVLMTALCLAAGLIAYYLVRQSPFALNQDTVLEGTDDEMPLVDTMQYASETETQPNNPHDDVSALRDELTSFDLELTDVMAPLPMEGVEPVGSTGN